MCAGAIVCVHELLAGVSAPVGFDAPRRRAYVAALNGDLEALDVLEPSGAVLVQGEGIGCCKRYKQDMRLIHRTVSACKQDVRLHAEAMQLHISVCVLVWHLCLAAGGAERASGSCVL